MTFIIYLEGCAHAMADVWKSGDIFVEPFSLSAMWVLGTELGLVGVLVKFYVHLTC